MLGDVRKRWAGFRNRYRVGILDVGVTVVYHYSVTTSTLLCTDVKEGGVRTTVTVREVGLESGELC